MNILGISGSLRSSSTNTNLLRAIAKLAAADVNFTLYDGLDKLPYFSPELDFEGAEAPPAVAHLRAQLDAADAIIVSTPEYAFGAPGVLKNALDWIVSSANFTDKPTAVISASPMHSGGDKANASITQTLRVMQATIPENIRLMIGSVKIKINAAGEITDPALENELKNLLQTLRDLHIKA
jgi:chromate reductase, NAD(P)H dehydrogenase (quinone)